MARVTIRRIMPNRLVKQHNRQKQLINASQFKKKTPLDQRRNIKKSRSISSTSNSSNTTTSSSISSPKKKFKKTNIIDDDIMDNFDHHHKSTILLNMMCCINDENSIIDSVTTTLKRARCRMTKQLLSTTTIVSDNSNEHRHLFDLSDSLLIRIFSHLNNPLDVMHLSIVNRRLHSTIRKCARKLAQFYIRDLSISVRKLVSRLHSKEFVAIGFDRITNRTSDITSISIQLPIEVIPLDEALMTKLNVLDTTPSKRHRSPSSSSSTSSVLTPPSGSAPLDVQLAAHLPTASINNDSLSHLLLHLALTTGYLKFDRIIVSNALLNELSSSTTSDDAHRRLCPNELQFVYCDLRQVDSKVFCRLLRLLQVKKLSLIKCELNGTLLNDQLIDALNDFDQLECVVDTPKRFAITDAAVNHFICSNRRPPSLIDLCRSANGITHRGIVQLIETWKTMKLVVSSRSNGAYWYRFGRIDSSVVELRNALFSIANVDMLCENSVDKRYRIDVTNDYNTNIKMSIFLSLQ